MTVLLQINVQPPKKIKLDGVPTSGEYIVGIGQGDVRTYTVASEPDGDVAYQVLEVQDPATEGGHSVVTVKRA